MAAAFAACLAGDVALLVADLVAVLAVAVLAVVVLAVVVLAGAAARAPRDAVLAALPVRLTGALTRAAPEAAATLRLWLRVAVIDEPVGAEALLCSDGTQIPFKRRNGRLSGRA